MPVWSAEIKELERLHETFKGDLPGLEKELERIIKADDENMILLYSRRCLEVIITDLCECELKRERGTEPLKGIIDKLYREKKVPPNIITSMHGLNELSTYGTHPKDFDPEQVKPVLNNLDIVIKWYLRYKDSGVAFRKKVEEEGSFPEIPEVSSAEKSIAVLPFVDMSPDKDQEYFCDGITEELINVLAHIENLKVIARTSAFAFKGKQIDIREIGRMLNVATLLEGSIRKADTKLRITAQLIKVIDGSHIWSEHYDRELKDVFAIQDEIALAITDNLKVKLIGETKATISKRRPDDFEAYNLYLNGIYCYQMMTMEGLEKSVRYFEQALQKDPDYALAYFGIALVNGASTFWGGVPPDEGYPKANEYANKALKMDNTLAETYWQLGNNNAFYYWNQKVAELNYRRAIHLNPNSPVMRAEYSLLLSCIGRHEEAICQSKRGQELDPLSGYVNTIAGLTYMFAGQFEIAIEEFQKSLMRNPNYFMTHFELGVTYFLRSMFRQAVTEYELAASLSNNNPFIIANLVGVYYLLGYNDKADVLFEYLRKRSETEYVPASSFFEIYMFIGEEDLAYDWLKKACIEHDTFIPLIKATPGIIPEDSRYMKLLKEMGLDF